MVKLTKIHFVPNIMSMIVVYLFFVVVNVVILGSSKSKTGSETGIIQSFPNFGCSQRIRLDFHSKLYVYGRVGAKINDMCIIIVIIPVSVYMFDKNKA